jgi:hypothetical protein
MGHRVAKRSSQGVLAVCCKHPSVYQGCPSGNNQPYPDRWDIGPLIFTRHRHAGLEAGITIQPQASLIVQRQSEATQPVPSSKHSTSATPSATVCSTQLLLLLLRLPAGSSSQPAQRAVGPSLHSSCSPRMHGCMISLHINLGPILHQSAYICHHIQQSITYFQGARPAWPASMPPCSQQPGQTRTLQTPAPDW